MTDTDNREELKEIAEYVREQRLETDLANVQGYGIDQGARSVRFSLASVAAVGNEVAALKNSVRANTEKIGTHTQQILDLGNSISGLGELPERNRRDIDTLGDTMREYGERLTRDEGSIRINTGTIESVSREVGRMSTGLNDAVERLDDAEQDITDLGRRLAQCQKMVYDLDGYRAYEGEVVQYGGEDGKYDHGGFYEWDGTEWVRLSVDDHTALEQKVKANTDAIATLNGGEQTSGSVKNTVLDYIGKAQHARFKVVDTLPPVKDAESNVLYLVPFEGKEGVYKQYILADGKFVQLDNTEVDLSNYYTKHETDTAISDVADALTAKDTEQDKRLDKLESGVTTNALQEVSNGIDGEFVETIIGEKTEGQQTIGVSVTIQPISTASEDNRGVAESSDVKNFVNDSLEEIDNALEDIINGEINVNILTAGNGVNIANNVISADTTILATKKDIENIKPQQSEQVQSDWNESDLTSKAYIQNKPNLHAVATSGSYNDLKDKPTINTNFVPYSDNLDAISDDLGVAWMNVSKESREFGHLYRKEQEGETIIIPTNTAYIEIKNSTDTENLPDGKYYRIREIGEIPNYNGTELIFTDDGSAMLVGYTSTDRFPALGSKVLVSDDDRTKPPTVGIITKAEPYDFSFEVWGREYKNISLSNVYHSTLVIVEYVNEQGRHYITMNSKMSKDSWEFRTCLPSLSENGEFLGFHGKYFEPLNNHQYTTAEVVIGGSTWKDVYDTSSNIPQLNTPHLYVISCELKPTTSTDTDSYDAVMYFNILHNKDTITIDELKSMLLGKRHPAAGYKGDDAIVSFVINQYDMSYRTISQENNALIGGFEIHGTYQVF